MAVAGLSKASVFDSYLGDNHSPASRRRGNKERSTSRTSFIRKMWRDLESKSRVGENGRRPVSDVLTGLESPCSSSLEGGHMESEDMSKDANEIENECTQNQNQNQIALQNGQEGDSRLHLQRSPSFNVPEKEHLRKIFHDWGNKSFGGHTLYSSHTKNCSRAQWLGENECKRVRIVRERIESSTQQGETCRTGLEEPATEIGSQIRRVQDGSVDCGIGTRRSIHRIYGRQALLDLLTKFEKERERELEGLLENRFVSSFAHRHRIQSLLKGRFVWNQKFVEDEKQTSVAESELGLLRQTHAVSDIRKGFLSRLYNCDHTPEGAQSDSDTSSDNEMNYDRIERAEEIAEEIPDEIGEELETTNLTSDWESHNPPEPASPVGESHDNERQKPPLTVDHAPGDHHSDLDTSSDNEMKYDCIEQAEEIVQEIPDEIGAELETINLTSDWEAHNPQEFTETRSQDHDDSVERNPNIYHIQSSQGTLGAECIPHGPLPEVDEVMLGHAEELEIHEASVHLHPLQTSTDSFNWQEVSTQAEEWHESVTEDDDGGWHHLTRIESGEGVDVNSNEWYQETARNDFHESHEEWYANVLEDATESWSDDDNGSRLELRELTSRRTVSNLLQSDFGARLDQLMQSYVDRQDQSFESQNEWMLGREQQSLDEHTGGIEGIETTEGAHPSSSVIPQGDNDLQGAADRQFPNILGTEREIIVGLRIDMEMLEQRMNEMQRMLEACMDMQLELQRSVQQEVYSALNQSSSNSGDGIWNYQSESSPGKEGACFVCCDDGFDSLPDRLLSL